MCNEAVLEHPETIAWMGNRSDDDDGPFKERIFGHTKAVSLLKTQIELVTGKPMARPVIPGIELRLQKKIRKTHSAVDAAQRLNARKAERAARKAHLQAERKARLNSKGA